MLDNGIKPVFVFDGKPPTLKSGEVRQCCRRYFRECPKSDKDVLEFQLAKRKKRQKEAEEAKLEAKEEGSQQLTASSITTDVAFTFCFLTSCR
jgi:flap endonuclease-1